MKRWRHVILNINWRIEKMEKTKALVGTKSFWGWALALPLIIKAICNQLGIELPASEADIQANLATIASILAFIGAPLNLLGIWLRKSKIGGIFKS
jgi:hypothetical protein